MRTLGRNRIFFLKGKEAGIKAGIAFSEIEKLHLQILLGKGDTFL